MTQNKHDSPKEKISAEFAARLDALGPQQQVRAILLLRGRDPQASPAQRPTAADRQASAELMRRSAEQALDSVDKILERFCGQRRASRPDVLGSIPIETTAAGIKALAESEWVKAVMEDQEIHPVL